MIAMFRLVIRSGPTAGNTFPLEKSEVFVGRDTNNDIVINDPEISRRHARFFLQGSSYVLEDLGSTNGCFVNGQRLVGPYALRPGEMITFGEHISLLFESMRPDQDATRISEGAYQPSTQQAYQQPVYQAPPPPPPAYQAPPPQRMAPPPPPPYAGQVPPQYYQPVQKKGFPTWIIVLVVIAVFFCIILAAVLWFMPADWWCNIFGWFDPTMCNL